MERPLAAPRYPRCQQPHRTLAHDHRAPAHAVLVLLAGLLIVWLAAAPSHPPILANDAAPPPRTSDAPGVSKTAALAPTYGVPTADGIDGTMPDGLARCVEPAWALCTVPAQVFGAVMLGRDGASIPMTFQVGSYEAFLASGTGVSDSVATAGAASLRAFVWGAPFFLGKRVTLLLEGRTLPGRSDATDPLYAIADHGTR